MPNAYTSYIARRLFFSSERRSSSAKPAVNVALIGLVVGIMTMLISVCVVIGFKQTIIQKVSGFGAHIQVVSFDNNNTFEMEAIAVPDSLLHHLRRLTYVDQVLPFATKPGIIKTEQAFQGIVFKGLPLDSAAALSFYQANMVEGDLPRSSQEVLLSRQLATLLGLQIGDDFLTWFITDDVRVRKLVVSGLYETGIGEMDERFVVGDIGLVRQLNGWTDEQASGIEIRAVDLNHLYQAEEAVWMAICNKLDEQGRSYHVQNMIQLNPQIFAWLDLLDMNVVIILLLMIAVSGFSIISGLIILILDSVRLIGVLKSLGASNGFVRRVFMHQAAWLIGKGMLWGNALGLSLMALQYFTHLLPLDATTYYVSYVPIAFPWALIIGLNIAFLLISLLILVGPSYLITRISPARVMQFE